MLNINKKKLTFLLAISFSLFFLFNFKDRTINPINLKVGIISLCYIGNVGNILVKIAMYNLLKSLKFKPCIIATICDRHGLDFLNKSTNLRIVENFSEIKKDDYNILIVNSDQTWRNWKNKKLFYNIAFLKFAENWTIHKFTYGVSLGNPYLDVGGNEVPIVKRMISNFSGFSVREKSSIEILNKTLGIEAEHVIDPTMFFDKNFYLNLINKNKNSKKLIFSNNCLFRYFLTDRIDFWNASYVLSKSLNYDIFSFNFTEKDLVPQFIEGLNNCKSVITDSFHASVFSIIFNKPFVIFLNTWGGDERLLSLNETFSLGKRIQKIDKYKITDVIELLKTKPNIQSKKIKNFKVKSFEFLTDNLKLNK